LGETVIGEPSPDIINIAVIILLLVVPIIFVTWQGKPSAPKMPEKPKEAEKP
jgi:hypothetical protein